MSNEIPTQSRVMLKKRDGSRCLRCGMRGYQLHHRRRRAVRDEHTHAPSNLVTLCQPCHAWVHANPAKAQEDGYIVTAHTDRPDLRPVKTFRGWAHFDISGGYITRWDEEHARRTLIEEEGETA